VNLKGGVGKSTLCLNVAAALTKRRKSVLVIDLDLQASCVRWAERRDQSRGKRKLLPVEVTPMFGVPTRAQLRSACKGYEFALIDTAAHDEHIASAAIVVSDVVVVPLTASETDLGGTRRTIDLIQSKKLRRKPRISIVLNRVILNTKIGREIYRHIHEIWHDHMVRHIIHQRIEFANADMVGKTVLETQPNGKAARELLAVVRGITR